MNKRPKHRNLEQMKPKPKLARYNFVSKGDTGVVLANDNFYDTLEQSENYDLLISLFDIAYADAEKKNVKYMWVKLPKEFLKETRDMLDMWS